jgi:putative transposase
MRDTFFKLWVHTILKTEDGTGIIQQELEPLLHLEIEKRLIEQGCEVAAVNGDLDHVHLLFLMNPLLPLHEVIRFIQGVSQHWYHAHDFKSGWYKFKWQEGYCAYSVSESSMVKVQYYIQHQKALHAQLSYSEEIDRLNLLHNVDKSDSESFIH